MHIQLLRYTTFVWDPDQSSQSSSDDEESEWAQRVLEDKYQEVQIHCDEKWFLMCKNGKRVRVYPSANGQFVLPKSIKLASKRHVGKVMVFTAVGRPIYDALGVCVFDGKVMCECMVDEGVYVRGKKTGKKKITNVTVDSKKINQVMTKLFKIIQTKYGQLKTYKIWIQLDNATPHTAKATRKYLKRLHTEAKKLGWDIEVVFQPPRSPDFNVNDLMVYKALGALVDKIRKYSLIDIQKAVKKCWKQLNVHTISMAFLVLFRNYLEVLKNAGGNDYNYPHTGLRQKMEDCFTDGMEMPAVLIKVPKALHDECVGIENEYQEYINEYNAGRAITEYEDSDDEEMADTSGSEDDSDDDSDDSDDDMDDADDDVVAGYRSEDA